MNSCENNSTGDGLATWVGAGVLAFAVAGTVDWALAVWSSTDTGVVGALTSWVMFVSLWVLGAVVWSLISGTGLWMVRGRVSAAGLNGWIIATTRRWWGQRHGSEDARRLANCVAGVAVLVGFAAGSVAWTMYLIESANLTWLIAVTALAGQVGLAVVLAVVGMGLRRMLQAGFLRLKKREWMRWLSFPVVAAGLAVIGAAAAVGVVVSLSDVFFAVEGPALVLLVLAVLLHFPLACIAAVRLAGVRTVKWGVWIAPVAAMLAVGVVGQHSDARRIVVLHGEAANFAFHQVHHHLELDRLFDRSDCPLPGPDGPPEGMSLDEYYDKCLDPAYDRPTAREDVPEYDRPDFEQRPSFVFITWDSVRVDRLGYMGHYRDTTPNLDAFAEENMSFQRAFTQDSGTGPSFWSLMAGKTPFQTKLEHGHRFPPPIAEDERMLGELLEEAGYRNKAIMCGTVFERDYWGIRWGFERFDNVCGSDRREVAPVVTEEGIAAFEELADGDEPFFLWVHYFDPHHPYNSHPDIGYGDSTLERYDEELTYTDRYTAKLMETIEERRDGYERPLFTIFGADHGENFGEHGTDPHARNLYRIVTQIPKIVSGPGIEAGSVDAPVAFNDVYPSVLDLAGVAIPEETTMVSQVPLFYGAEPDDKRMVFQENSYSRPRRHTRAVVWDRYLYIMDLTSGTEELYDYVDDPLERINLVGTGLAEERILRQAVIRFLETSEIPEGLED